MMGCYQGKLGGIVYLKYAALLDVVRRRKGYNHFRYAFVVALQALE